MEYCVESTKDNRETLIDLLHPLGTVTNRWPDGTFNFTFYDATCVDEGTDILDERNVESKLI